MTACSEGTRKGGRDVAESSRLGERRYFGCNEEDVQAGAPYTAFIQRKRTSLSAPMEMREACCYGAPPVGEGS